MQADAKILHKSNHFTVKTKHDRQRLEAISVYGHRVLVLVRQERFHDIRADKSVEISYPAGTGLMFNGEQGIHQIFPGGMYQMLRSRSHASLGERDDAKSMREMGQLAFDFVARLRSWLFIGEEGRAYTDESLLRLAGELASPKRNERKLVASDRFRKSSQLRTKRDKRMPMPSAITASAGAHHLDLRRTDVQAILRWIDPERLAVHRLTEAVHDRFGDAWRMFNPAAANQSHPVLLAAAKPTTQTVKVMRDQLRPLYRGLKEVRVNPLMGLAEEAAVGLATLRDRIMNASAPVDVLDLLTGIRASLAAALLTHELEIHAISPVSLSLGRWRQIEPHRRELLRLRTAESVLTAKTSFERWADHLPAKRQGDIQRELDQAVALSTQEAADLRKQIREEKKALKRISGLLV